MVGLNLTKIKKKMLSLLINKSKQLLWDRERRSAGIAITNIRDRSSEKVTYVLF
jgi:hypothetical protein